MKTSQLVKYGGSEAMQLVDYCPVPEVTAGRVLVRAHAVGLNPFDWKVREGMLAQVIKLKLPVIWGSDFSGVVESVGEGVQNFKVGDEVFGSASILGEGSGALAEYTLVGTKTIALKPKGLSFEEASGLPLAGVSALEVCIERMKLTKGQRILIHGGAGGIGSFAIEIAKYIGAYVFATASAENTEYVKGLGADIIIDYKKEKFEEVAHDLDAVFDTVGGETNRKSYGILKRGGILVSMVEKPNVDLMNKFGVNAIAQVTAVDSQHLARLAELAEGKFVKVNVDKVFTLAEADTALSYLKDKSPRGKVVVKIL